MHIAGSCPAFHPPVPLSPSRQGCSRALLPPACIASGGAPTHVQHLALDLIEPHEVHTGPFLQLVQVPWMALRSSGMSTDTSILSYRQ